MILVTGAAGKTGRTIIGTLVARGERVRALVHRHVEGLGTQDLVIGDMRSQKTVDKAMRNVRAVYFICPNMSPDEIKMGQIAISAARSAGIEHFVYHSVLHPQTEAMPHHWQKLRVEEQLFESGVPYTILQPTAYMQNIVAHWPQILSEGIYPVPYRAEARISLVDLEDVAAVALTVLTQANHFGATYELVGTKPLTQIEIAVIVSQQLRRTVQAEVVPLETWNQTAQKRGLGNFQIKTLIKMFRYYDRYGLEGNPNVLSWLLGRSPTSFAEFIRRVELERSNN